MIIMELVFHSVEELRRFLNENEDVALMHVTVEIEKENDNDSEPDQSK